MLYVIFYNAAGEEITRVPAQNGVLQEMPKDSASFHICDQETEDILPCQRCERVLSDHGKSPANHRFIPPNPAHTIVWVARKSYHFQATCTCKNWISRDEFRESDVWMSFADHFPFRAGESKS